MSERSDIVYGHLNEANQRFEYFVLGLSGALVSYSAQALKPHKLDWSAYSLEIFCLALLILSILVGFKMLELAIHCKRLNADALHLGETRGKLKAAYAKGGSALNEATGVVHTNQSLMEQIARLDQNIPKVQEALARFSAKGPKLYKIRNRLLGIGFLGLFIARVLTVYFP